MNRIQTLALGILIGLGASALILLIARQPIGKPLALQPPPTTSPIEIYIAGAVVQPGLYQLPPGARVADAIGVAGGFTDEAVGEVINPARKLVDGEMILIPTKEDQVLQRGTRVDLEPVIEASVNVNTANADQLQQLPGVGPTKAAAIIEYRLQHGPFQSLEDLSNVPGIGDGIIEDIQDWVVFN